MMKNICFLCGREFIFEKWYGKCEHCKILIPESQDCISREIDCILDLRTTLSAHLFELEQKQISAPEIMTKKEKEERELWHEHNKIYGELMVFMDQYNIKKIRQCEIYPKLFHYVKIIEKIKLMYK